MNIAIDTSPLQNASSVRGIGFYTQYLIDGLKEIKDENQYHFVKNQNELNKINPDLIHYPFFDLFFLTLPKRQKTPVVVTVHDVTPLVLPELFPRGIKGSIKLHIQKKRLQTVDKIITDSICSKKDITKYLDIPPEKIEVVYLACNPSLHRETDTTKLTEVKKKYKLPDNYIVKVGDINKHKNFNILFDAMTRIPSMHLVLVGKTLAPDAPMIPELKEITEQIKYLSLEDRVHRLGFIDSGDINAIYTLARATMVNSFYEGFGLPALESMTCGTPVIASDTGSLTEVVGSSAIIINPYDVLETAAAIEQIEKMDDAKYRNLQERGLEQAHKFSVEKMVRETVEVYNSV